MESKTSGDQVAMALTQFRNNDNYKVPETLETNNDRLRAANYQLMECSGSHSASAATLRERFISCHHRIDLKSNPGPGHKAVELQKTLKA